jgi:hypothetical protein
VLRTSGSEPTVIDQHLAAVLLSFVSTRYAQGVYVQRYQCWSSGQKADEDIRGQRLAKNTLK